MKRIMILLILAIMVAGCVETTTTTTTIATTTTVPTTTTIETTTTVPTTTVPTTTTIGSMEKGIDIVGFEDGRVIIKNIGKVKEIVTSNVQLFINGQQVDPRWTFTVLYSTSTTKSRATCTDGDGVRVVGPVNTVTAVCVG